jgi:drug/metabolite transporter (DMT)-like permease
MNAKQLVSGVFLALLAALIWGGMFPVTKSALPLVNPFHLTLIRYGCASLLFMGILCLVEGPQALRLEGNVLRLLGLGSAGFAGFSLFAFVGLWYTQPQNASLIMATMPLMTVLLNAVRNKIRPRRFTLVCIAVALLGVVIVISKGNPALLLSGQVGFGDVLVVVGAVCWVIYTMGGASFKTWSPLRYTTLSALLGTCTIAVATLVATSVGYIHAPSLAAVYQTWWQMSYLIVIAAVVAVLAWNLGIKRLGAQNGILFMNLVPVTTFFITVVEGYRFSAMELVGAGLTIGALLANNLYQRRVLNASKVTA